MFKIFLLFEVLSRVFSNEFIRIENFHPPNGYQPVKGYEPPNFQYYPQNYAPKNQYENYQQPYQPIPNQYPDYQYPNNNQNYQSNVNNYENNWSNNNNNNYNNQWNQQQVNNQNSNFQPVEPNNWVQPGEDWRRTAPPTKYKTTTKWTGWTEPTTKYPIEQSFYKPSEPVTYPVPIQPVTTASTTVDWKQVFVESGSPSKNKYVESIQNNVGGHGLDDQCLKCLCFIESWCSDVGCVQDQGSLSCGWYQLKYEYWLDCGQPGGGWKECANSKRCAEDCVRAYMTRYSSFCSLGSSSCARLGRIHNGGPHGCSNNNTEYYGWLIDRCLRRQAPYEKIDSL
ncbi:unnamed protein product [Brachionus calyciflorus]|uniref:lysozyme n=1 Tax=Brachionus calyciflorus TaxID=104777 RepID=A0A814H7I3_9BILA|nr:unnamed protein product [Brachionus calyciflorus]